MSNPLLAACGVLLATYSCCSTADALLIISGSPAYDSTTGTGLKLDTINLGFVPGRRVNNFGLAIGFSNKYTSTTNVGTRPVAWNSIGSTNTELGTLGLSSTNTTNGEAYAITSESNWIVGSVRRHVAGVDMGRRAVRYQGTLTAIEMATLGTSATGYTDAEAYAINENGVSAGLSKKYNGSGVPEGSRAVRWSSTGTATELGNLGLSSVNSTEAAAYDIDDFDTAVGWSYKYTAGVLVGKRAVRWFSAGSANELGNLGLSSTNTTNAEAYDYESNTAVGYSEKYVSGANVGTRAVAWVSSTTTELGNLGVSTTGVTNAAAYSTNGFESVGYAQKYESGVLKGTRAVRWNNGNGAATELQHLGLHLNGTTNAAAYRMNSRETAVGYSEKYEVIGSTTLVYGNRAALWLADGSVIDLNDLGLTDLAAGGTWTLTSLNDISEDGWVSGIGTFDPTGAPTAYNRRFVTQVGLGGEWLGLGGLSTFWDYGGAWSTGTPAMEVGEAIFNANSTYTVEFLDDKSTQSITVNAGDVTFDFYLADVVATDALTINNGTLILGNYGSLFDAGSVKIMDGTLAVGTIPTANNTNALLNTDHLSSFSTGTLQLRGATVTISESVTTLLSGLTISGRGILNARMRGFFNVEVTGGTLAVGDITSFQGFRTDGTIVVSGNGTLNIRDRDSAGLGELTVLDSGTIQAANGLSLGSSRALFGTGTVSAPFSALAGSTIEAAGSLTIGANSPNGFSTFGELHVGSHTVTLVDSNQVVLGAGSWTTLDGGTLDAETSADGLLIDFGATISGSGTILAPNDPFNATMLNGEVIGESLANPIEIGGFVRGVGSVDNVIFTGTYSPGFSPAQVYVGNFGYSSNSVAIMEIGGEAPGSEHDQIVSSGTIQLAGTLQLDILNNYEPEYGVAHEIYTGQGIVGQFAQIDGVAIDLTRYLAVTYDADSVFVTAALPGDANLDGEVGFSDLLTVAQNYDMTDAVWANGDFDGAGIVNFTDLLITAQNYGMSVINGDLVFDATMNARFDADWQLALTSVPEPGALGLVATSLLLVRRRRLA